MTKRLVNYRKPQPISRRWLQWLALVLLLIALLLMAKLAWKHWRPSAPAAAGSNPAPSAAITPVQFDFYTVLPKVAVEVPASPLAAVLLAPKAKTTEMYILQVAALRQLQDAQKLRDQMRTAGYTAFIQSYQTGQAVWYRVMLGPYVSEELAQQTQDLLKDQRIDSLLLKSKP